MDVNALIYFAFVVEEGSFQAAARKLRVPNSTLSRHISALEAALDVQLLNRTTRRLSMTEAGENIFPSCQKMAEEYRSVLDITQEASSQPHGLLRVTAPVAAGRVFLARWLAQFSQRFPEIVLDVFFSDEEEDMVERRIDVAVRVGSLRSSTLISRPLATTSRIVCASPEFVAAHPVFVAQDLSGMSAVIFARASEVGHWRLNCQGETIEVSVQPRLVFNDMTSVLEAAAASGGIALVPAFVANSYLRNGSLMHIVPSWSGEAAPFHLVYLRRDNLPTKTKLLIAHFLECAATEAGLFASLND